jgi:outer membrane protein TolC
MKHKLMPIIYALVIAGEVAYAQTPFASSSVLENYVQEGIANNLALSKEELAVKQQMLAIKEAKGRFLPQVSLNADYTLAGGGRAIQFPIGDLLNPIYDRLNQLGGSSDFPSNLPNEEVQFLPNNFHDTKLRVVQPLINPDLYHNLNAKRSELAMQEAGRDAFKNQLIEEIRVAYFNYLQTEEVDNIYDKTEEVLKEVLRVNQKLVENQKATKDVVYRSEFELSQLVQQQAQALRDREAARNYFNFLLNRELAEVVIVDENLKESAFVDPLPADLDVLALQNRKELRQLTHALSANHEAIQLYRHTRLPRLSAMLDAGYQGYGYKFNDEQDYWMGGVSMQWDLFKGFQNEAKVQQLTVQEDIIQKNYTEMERQIQLEVADNHNQLEAAQRSVQAARKGVVSAYQNFDIIQKKYRQQQATLLELLDARNTYTRSQLNAAIAHYDYLKKVAMLESSVGGQTAFK